MRNITKDLKERLAELETEITKTQKRLDELIVRQKGVKVLITAEESRWHLQKPLIPEFVASSRNDALPPLSQFVFSRLENGDKTLETLMKEAEENNVAITAAKPGRAIHFALVGLKRKGLAEKTDGIWRLKHENTTSVAGRIDGPRASASPTQPV